MMNFLETRRLHTDVVINVVSMQTLLEIVTQFG